MVGFLFYVLVSSSLAPLSFLAGNLAVDSPPA